MIDFKIVEQSTKRNQAHTEWKTFKEGGNIFFLKSK